MKIDGTALDARVPLGHRTRRGFLRLLSGSAGAAVLGASWPRSAAAGRPATQGTHSLGAPNCAGWQLAIGDGSSSGASLADIAHVALPDRSDLVANSQSQLRNVHAILYLPQPGEVAMSAVHHLGGLFRLNSPESAETVEFHFFTYRGDLPSKLDHGFALQWVCNSAAPDFRSVRLWDGPTRTWLPSGVVAEIDTAWHFWESWVDYPSSLVYISIPSFGLWKAIAVTAEHKPDFGTDVTSRLGFEVISKNGGAVPVSTSWRDWFWTWPAVPRTAPVDGRPLSRPQAPPGSQPGATPSRTRAPRLR